MELQQFLHETAQGFGRIDYVALAACNGVSFVKTSRQGGTLANRPKFIKTVCARQEPESAEVLLTLRRNVVLILNYAI